jgi:1-deoxy-D-xylulose-5-phosphate reductoisomerase
VLDAADAWTADPATVADVLAAQEWARARAREIVRENAQGVAR